MSIVRPGGREAGTASHIQGLDVIRGLAALLVVLGHSRELFLGDRALPLQGSSLLERSLLAPSSFAVESVAVFFVLSGYLVGGQLIRAVRSREFGWRRYIANRVSRLSTVLVPGLVITLLLDLIRYAMEGQEGGLQNTGPLEFLCNAVYLQGPYCDTYGSNDSLWSISYEFWFYIVAAGIATVILGTVTRSGWRIVLGVLVAVGCVLLFGPTLLLYIPAWVLGALLSPLSERLRVRVSNAKRRNRIALVLGSVVVLLAAMLVSNLQGLDRPVTMILVGIATAPLILFVGSGAGGRGGSTIARFAWFGTWSYSVYIFHMPIVLVLVVAFQSLALSTMAAVGMVYLVAALAAAASIGLYWPFERNTQVVRGWLLSLLRVPPRRG